RPRPVEAPAESSVQDAAVRPRRMAGWQPLSVANTAVKASPPEPAPAEPVVEEPVLEEPLAETPGTSAGPIQDPDVPRRRMAGWTPLTVAHDAPPVAPAPDASWEAATEAKSSPPPQPPPQTATVEHEAEPAPAAQATPTSAPAASVAQTEDLPRRR